MENELPDMSTPLKQSFFDTWYFALETTNNNIFGFSHAKDCGDSIIIYDGWENTSGYNYSGLIFPDKRGIQIFKAHIVIVWDCSGKT